MTDALAEIIEACFKNSRRSTAAQHGQPNGFGSQQFIVGSPSVVSQRASMIV
jgi:hypothetical protein